MLLAHLIKGFGLPVRKRFVARVVRLDTLDRSVGIVPEEVDRLTIGGLCGLYSAIVEDLNRDQFDDHIPLDVFLSRIWTEVSKWWDPDGQLGCVSAPRLHFVRDAFSEALKQIDCTQCCTAAGLPHKCNGSGRDNLVVAQGGECVTSLTKCFAFALWIAEGWYRSYSTYLSDQSKVAPVGFALVGKVEQPLLSPLWAVKAFTSYSETAETQTSKTPLPVRIVRLEVATTDIRWEELQSLLYVLFHECIAHAFEGLVPSMRDHPRAAWDAWTEGWMDWTAFHLMEETLKETEPKGVPDDLLPRWPRECVRCGRLLYNDLEKLDRGTIRKHSYPKHVWQRQRGRQLAEFFHNMVYTLQIDRAEPSRPFYQLTADMNLRSDLDRNVWLLKLHEKMYDLNFVVRPGAIEWAKHIVEDYWENTDGEGKQDVNVIFGALA